MLQGLHMGRAENRASGRHNAPRYAFVQPRCDTTVVIHATIQQHLYPAHIRILILNLNLGPPLFCLRLCASGIPQPRERIEGTAPRIALHALLEQPTRHFFRPRDIFTPTTHAAAIGRFRREKKPDAMGWKHKPCGRRDEDSGGDARGPDMRG